MLSSFSIGFLKNIKNILTWQRQQRMLVSVCLAAWLVATVTNVSARTPGSDPIPGTAVTASQYAMYLPMLADGRPALAPALQAIDDALKAGTINLETALLYKAQAVLEDPALPAPYRGSVGDDSQRLMNDVRKNLAKVSPAAQARLRPYLLPPSSTESWYTRNVMQRPVTRAATAQSGLTWQTIETANGKVKLWYHPEIAGHTTRAQHIAAEIDRYMWDKLAELFGKQMAPDCGVTCAEGGGDGRYDIYVLDRDHGWSGPYGCCTANTGWAQIGRSLTFGEIASILALSWAETFPVASWDEYMWVRSAASAYAIDYLYPVRNGDPDYPRANEEHVFARYYMDQPWVWLEFFDKEAYLFFFYMARYRADPFLVRHVLENGGDPDSLSALDKAMDGTLEGEWRDFALFTYNSEPVRSYRDDQLFATPATTFALSNVSVGTHTFPISTAHMSTDYFQFGFLDPAVRKVTFTNPVAEDQTNGGHVWALVYTSKGAFIEDWAMVKERTFCKDNPAEDIQNVVLVISSGRWDDRNFVLRPGDGTVKAEAQCKSDVTGTVSWNFRESSEAPNFSRLIEQQATLQVRLRYDAEMGNYVDDGSTYSYSGSMQMESYSPSNNVRNFGSRSEIGSGSIALKQGVIGGYIEGDAPRRRFGLTVTLPYDATSSTTQVPGGTETSTDSSTVKLTCEDLHDLIGRETATGAFDMACSVTVSKEGVVGTTQVTGVLKVNQ